MNEDPTLPLDNAQPTSAEAPDARSSWGNFNLLARVGHGGFGEVYRAWDPHLQREVALKLLLPSVAGGDAQYALMLSEARALASVQHPNVVRVYGIDRHDGRVGFWTDFVKGKTLSVQVGEQGPFGCREAALIAIDVSRALSAVHRAGILHRDIKAENVMREEGGRILLMDFGLSSLPQRGGNLSGTPSYMAPELFDGQPATVQTDVYAMGVLLYYLVTGTYPVKLPGLSIEQARSALKQRTPLMDLRSDLPDSFLRTVSIAIELDPAKRFASAGQLAAALVDSLGTSSTVEPPTISNRTRFSRWMTIALPAAFLMLMTAGLALHFRNAKASPPPSQPAARSTEYDGYLKAQDLLLKSYQIANTTKAVKAFQDLLASDETFALAHAGLGTAYFIQYRASRDPKLLALSEAATNRAIQLDPTVAPPYVTLARIAAMEGNTAVATQYAQKAMTLDPRSADAYHAVAEVYDAQGRTQDAVAAMQKAEDLAPDDWRWPLDLGNYYFAEGKLKEAADKYQRSVDLAPDNAIAYKNIGLVKMQMNKLDEAKADFEHSLNIETFASTQQMLGEILIAQENYPEAITAEQKAAGLSPDDYTIWGDLGVAYYMANDRTKATAAYKRALETGEAARAKEPKDANLLVMLANYDAMLGEKDQSRVLLRQSLALSADDPSIDYRAGATYELLQQREQAMDLIAKAIGRGYHTAEFERDPLLASLRHDARWAGVLRQHATQNPVDTSAKMN